MALEQFRVGQSITGYEFDTSAQKADILSVLSQINYSADGNATLATGPDGITGLDVFHTGTLYLIAYMSEEFEITPLWANETGSIAEAGLSYVEGFQNLNNGAYSIPGGGYEVRYVNETQGWNGVFIGVVGGEPAPTPSLTPFRVGQTITGFDFGNVQNGDESAEMDTFLAGLTYEEGVAVLLSGTEVGTGYTCSLVAFYEENVYAIGYIVNGAEEDEATILYSSEADPDFGAAGYKNLTDGKYTLEQTASVGSISDAQGWNGILMGAVEEGGEPTYTDTVTAGTYSAATGIWTDNADYELTDDGAGTYAVTGLIPYGRADSLFAFAGYRFAVKISRDTITSRDDLPDGNICTVTVGGETSTYTKSAFETDGSLIYIAAPVRETLATPRVVKIAWSIAGSTVEESDFTSYTFDLSGAELAPIPEEAEDESRVAYCITPKITSDKFVKVVAPSGGLRAGQVVNCVALASAVEGVPMNLDVYSPSLPTNATLDSRFYALIVNGGFEKLEDGRRPSGNPDYTTYVYNEGDVCQGILIDKNLVFEISGSCISGDTSIDPSADIGRYIVPTNGTYVLSIANAPTAGGCFKIIGTSYFRKGGLYNDAFVATYIALAIH